MKIRFVNGEYLSDSMKTVQEANTITEIVNIIKHRNDSSFCPDPIRTIGFLYEGYDERCDWFTWLVCINSQASGHAELVRHLTPKDNRTLCTSAHKYNLILDFNSPIEEQIKVVKWL